MTLAFTQWDHLRTACELATGCRPYSGVGICYRKERKTCILRSVDGTNYYADDLSDPERVEYTLFGQYGDQDEDEPKFNRNLLDSSKTHRIFLYRVARGRGQTRRYTWYGEYTIAERIRKIHPDKDGVPRRITVLILTKLQ